MPQLCVNFAGTAVVVATDPVEVDYIVADHIADIAEKMETAAERVDIAGLALPAV